VPKNSRREYGGAATASLPAFALAALGLFAVFAWAQDQETQSHLLHELGGPFFVSRENVQDDLTLTDQQKRRLQEKLSGDVREAGRIIRTRGGARNDAMLSLRQASYQSLEKFLNDLLAPEQLKRFHQLELQYDTPAVMLGPEIGNRLHITDDQRRQFVGIVLAMKNEIEPLVRTSRSGGNPKEILPKVIELRRDCQAKIETLLSESQKQQWREMTGRPLDIW
jgi:hypothetical protein